mgnify:CR=1 FL=1|tara:strand:- start:220 stop:612 length:393 start_codon:yes stop_codon:yes gene_type:complete
MPNIKRIPEGLKEKNRNNGNGIWKMLLNNLKRRDEMFIDRLQITSNIGGADFPIIINDGEIEMIQVKEYLLQQVIQVGDSFKISIESVEIDESEMTMTEYFRNVDQKLTGKKLIKIKKEKEIIEEWKSWN